MKDQEAVSKTNGQCLQQSCQIKVRESKKDFQRFTSERNEQCETLIIIAWWSSHFSRDKTRNVAYLSTRFFFLFPLVRFAPTAVNFSALLALFPQCKKATWRLCLCDDALSKLCCCSLCCVVLCLRVCVVRHFRNQCKNGIVQACASCWPIYQSHSAICENKMKNASERKQATESEEEDEEEEVGVIAKRENCKSGDQSRWMREQRIESKKCREKLLLVLIR